MDYAYEWEDWGLDLIESALPKVLFTKPVFNNVIKHEMKTAEPEVGGEVTLLGWEATVRSSVAEKAEAEEWIRRFGESTDTAWIVRSARKCQGKQLKFWKSYMCQHSSVNKAKDTKNNRTRNCDCQAKIALRIFSLRPNTVDKSKLDFPTEFRIRFIHTHSIGTPEDLSFLRADAATTERFRYYFNELHLSADDAKAYHEAHLLRDCGFDSSSPEFLKLRGADSAKNPRLRAVRYLYNAERKLQGGSMPSGIGDILMKLEDKNVEWSGAGVRMKMESVSVQRKDGKPANVLIGAVVTPLMERAHTLKESGDIVFVDGTSASGSNDNHVMAVLLAPTAAGGLPLGVVVCSGKPVPLERGLELLKEVFDEFPGESGAFGGLGCPRYFMTNDREADRCATLTALCYCTVHDKAAAAENLYELRNCGVGRKYENWENFLDSLLGERQEMWSLSSRGRNIPWSNSYGEIPVRIPQEVLLKKSRAYNLVALMEFSISVLDGYYRRRLGEWGREDETGVERALQDFHREASYLSRDDVTDCGNVFFVPSSSSADAVAYMVCVPQGGCSCEEAHGGHFCTHQGAISQLFPETRRLFPNAPHFTHGERARIRFVADGPILTKTSAGFYEEADYGDPDEISDHINMLGKSRGSIMNIKEDQQPIIPSILSPSVTEVEEIKSEVAQKFMDVLNRLASEGSVESLRAFRSKLGLIGSEAQLNSFLATGNFSLNLATVGHGTAHEVDTDTPPLKRRRIQRESDWTETAKRERNSRDSVNSFVMID